MKFESKMKSDHEWFLSRPERQRQYYRRVALRSTKRPETTCPNCQYDLHGVLKDEKSFALCPECGSTVSTPGAIMAWWCSGRFARSSRIIFVISGPMQVIYAGLFVMLAKHRGWEGWDLAIFYILWRNGLWASLIPVVISAWFIQSNKRPRRSRATVALVTVMYAVAFFVLFYGITLGVDRAF